MAKQLGVEINVKCKLIEALIVVTAEDFGPSLIPR